MSTLTDFLKEEAQRLRAESQSAQERRDEWIASLGRLMPQLRQWLEQADTEKVLNVVDSPASLEEEGLGKYTVPRLKITLGTRRINVLPFARNVVGSLPGSEPPLKLQGRVDVVGPDEKYMLYRVQTPEGEKWFIVDDERYRFQPLDKASFEAAVLSMLQ